MYIHIASEDGEFVEKFQTALKQNADGLIFTTLEKAELVILKNDDRLLHIYDPDTQYALIIAGDYPMMDLPKNVSYVPAKMFLGKMLEVIFRIKNRPMFIEVMDGVLEVAGDGYLDIMVVDPDMIVRDDAKTDLWSEAKDLVLVGRYSDALQQLRKRRFNAVLTSLYLLASPDTPPYLPDYEELRKEVPYGLILAMEAAKLGSSVCVVCDASMKHDPIVAALGNIGPYEYNETQVSFWTRGKQWQRALKHLIDLE
jgi:hypothetical protein